MIVFILAAFITLACYCVSLLKWPFRSCRKCQGRGTNKGSNRKRWGACPKCHGSKQVRRLGASAVHRFWWSVLGSAMHERRKERVEEARKKAGYPELLWTRRPH